MSTHARKLARGTAVLAAVLLAAMTGVPAVTPASAASGSQPGSQASCPWLDESLPVATRVSELLSAMSLSQKLDLLGLANQGDYENVTTAIPSLCVPQFELNDGPAGIVAGPADSHTQLPSPVGLAATFDPALANELPSSSKVQLVCCLTYCGEFFSAGRQGCSAGLGSTSPDPGWR